MHTYLKVTGSILLKKKVESNCIEVDFSEGASDIKIRAALRI